MGHWKVGQAGEVAPAVRSAASPVPQVEITPALPPGKKGPVGTAPRTNYSRVNTGTPPTPDAGSEGQKSVAPRGAETLPKVASNEGSMGTMTQRPRLQDMVKAAMENSLDRVDITQEAARQAANMGEETPAEKTAKPAPVGAATEKKASAEYALKLASAVEFIVENLDKEAGHVIEGPPGVSQATKSEMFPAHQGQGHHQPPMKPGMQKGLPKEEGATQLANDIDHTPGGSEKMILTNYGKKTAAPSVVSSIRKVASSKEVKSKEAEVGSSTAAPKAKAASVVASIRTKLAEDAINPAKISAGSAVPPESSASGEAGGQPVGGAPQGPTGLVGSNEAATNFTRGQAYANRKQDLKKYLDEPAMSSETDKTLAQAFEHTPQAGTKFSSALSTKTAAAKALIENIDEEVTAQSEQRSA